jgi:hypothetical protein
VIICTHCSKICRYPFQHLLLQSSDLDFFGLNVLSEAAQQLGLGPDETLEVSVRREDPVLVFVAVDEASQSHDQREIHLPSHGDQRIV